MYAARYDYKLSFRNIGDREVTGSPYIIFTHQTCRTPLQSVSEVWVLLSQFVLCLLRQLSEVVPLSGSTLLVLIGAETP